MGVLIDFTLVHTHSLCIGNGVLVSSLDAVPDGFVHCHIMSPQDLGHSGTTRAQLLQHAPGMYGELILRLSCVSVHLGLQGDQAGQVLLLVSHQEDVAQEGQFSFDGVLNGDWSDVLTTRGDKELCAWEKDNVMAVGEIECQVFRLCGVTWCTQCIDLRPKHTCTISVCTPD